MRGIGKRKLFRVTEDEIEYTVPVASEVMSCCHRFSLLPDYLRQLLIGDDIRTRTFRKNLRKYNSALKFTSVNYNPDRRLPRNGRGPVCFQIHGELYHLQGPLDPVDDSPRFAQLFFYDPNEATAIRTRQNTELDPDIVRRLTEMLHNMNPFIRLYKSASEALRVNAATTDDRRVTDPTASWYRYANDICDDLPYRLRSITDVPDDLMSPHLDHGLY